MVSKLWKKSVLGILAFILVFQFFPYSNGKVEAAGSWTVDNAAGTSDLYNITFSNNEFVAVGRYGTIETSTDGTNWSDHSVDANHFSDVLYTGTRWIAAGQYGDMGVSADGEDWDYGYSLAPTNVKGLASNGSMVVAVGSGGQIKTSLDNGSSWTNQAAFEVQFNDVTYGNEKFVAVGNGGAVYTSTDGVQWYPYPITNGVNLNQVVYGKYQFVAVGDGAIYTSYNGSEWTRHSLPNDVVDQTSLFGVAYAGGKYIAVGAGGVVMVSADGNSWTTENADTTLDLKGIAAGNGKFVAVGLEGQVRSQSISSNADLSSLNLENGTFDLSPSFDPAATDYTATVPYNTDRVTVKAVTADDYATVAISPWTPELKTTSSSFALNVGPNTMTIPVTAQDGTQKTYKIIVTRERMLSNNASLSALDVSQNTLNPPFVNTTENSGYMTTVAGTVTSVDVTAVTDDSNATLKINGEPATSGTPFPVTLDSGELSAIQILVTAENKLNSRNYVIWVQREPAQPSTNANLMGLTISSGRLTPDFAKDTTSYTATVGNEITSEDVTATAEDPAATLTINGTSAGSGSPSSVPLVVGDNTITVRVTPESGTVKEYTIVVTREEAPQQGGGTPQPGGGEPQQDYADLLNLTLSQGTLSPAFLPETTSYTASVRNAVSNVDVTATVADLNSTLTINGTHTDSGVASNVLLKVGVNPITVVVTSGTGTTKTYTLVVTREASGSPDSYNPPAGPSGNQGSPPVVGSGSNVEEITVEVQTAKSNDNTTVAKTLVKRTTEANGTKKDDVTFTADKVEETLKQISSQGLDTARIVIPDKEDVVSLVNVTIPKLSVERLSEGQANLEVYTENAMIGIPKVSLQQFDQDLYFKFIPIKDASGKKNAEDRAKKDEMVQDIAKDAATSIQVLGRPMTIETNMQSRTVTLTMPLRDADLPVNVKQRQHVLDNVSVFIEHSDNTKELKKGKVVIFPDGSQGIQISVDKFSTFTMVYMDGEPHEAYIKGYPDHSFRPDASVTRAEIAAMLARNLDVTASSASAGYTDINHQNWAYNEILQVQQYGIMVGDKGVFRPNSSITRAEMAAIVNRWLSKEAAEHPTATGTDQATSLYTDTANHWAINDIEAIRGLDIMEGYEDGSFRPNSYLTRAEAVKVLNRLFNRGPLYGTYTPSFSDVKEEHWSYREVEEAARNHTYSISEEGQESLVNNLD